MDPKKKKRDKMYLIRGRNPDVTKNVHVKTNPKSLTDKCIVIDIDETLLYSCEDLDDFVKLGVYTDPNNCDLRPRIYIRAIEGLGHKRGDGSISEICGILRPHLHDFLRFCFDYFRVVAIWTAGLHEYGLEMVDWMFRDIADPHIIYTRDHCDKRDGNNEKPLNKMFECELPGIMTHKNTFILDDNGYSFDNVNPKNAILIPHYRPRLSIEGLHKDDPSLRELMVWLMRPEVVRSTDVQPLDKSNIFSLLPPPNQEEDQEEDLEEDQEEDQEEEDQEEEEDN
jgi:NLI interacting factor-like phosphatase